MVKTGYLFINGIKREVNLSQTIMQACESYGIKIPHFCFHDKLSVAGNCRMCLVEEVKKSPKPLQASCAITVVSDMSIYTNSALVKKAREGVLEFLLANHPLDCPICDQGGECDLQDQALVFGSDRGRFYEQKRAVEDKNFGPLIKTVMTRCIHCTRCVRYMREIAGLKHFGITGRGSQMEIGFYISNSLNSEISGNVIDVCPVGALTSKPYAFKARPWELSSYNSIDLSDAFGSNVRIDVLGNKIVRVLPRINKKINDCWISDKVRFSYDAYKIQRLLFPMLKNVSGLFERVSWEAAYNNLIQFIQRKKPSLSFYDLAIDSSLESQYSAMGFFRSLGMKMIVPAAVNTPLNSRLMFNSGHLSIDRFLRADLILLVNVNPAYDAAVFNIYLRQLAERSIPVFTVGFNPTNLNFNFTTLGNDLSILNKIISGNHYICNYLMKANNPYIFFSSSLIDTTYYRLLLNLQKGIKCFYAI